MGRPGRAGGGGGRSIGSRSSSRISGGHRVSSSRPRSTSSLSSMSRPKPTMSTRPTIQRTPDRYERRPDPKPSPMMEPIHPHNPAPVPPPRRPKPVPIPRPAYRPRPVPVHSVHVGPSYISSGKSVIKEENSKTNWTVLLVIILSIMLAISGCSLMMKWENNTPSIVRTAIENPAAYGNDCIVDELEWFENIPDTSTKLKSFYDLTGVQPYIVLNEYDSNLLSDTDKEEWALNYYEENIDNENTFLYVYFAEEYSDNEVGYMCYVNGKQTSSIMDAAAVEIFWNNLDRYWYSDLSTDDMFIQTFTKTADEIMAMPEKSSSNPAMLIFVLSSAGLVSIGIYEWRKKKRAMEKEKAEETERILNTPLQELAKDAEAERIADKY